MNPTQNSPTILIVDNDPKYQQYLKNTLSVSGFQVVSAHNGETAFAYFSQYDPNLVLLEAKVDRVSGFEICRKIRCHSQRPIIFFTYQDDEASRIKALDLGADDFLKKSFAFHELLARIQALLRRVENTWREERPRRIFQHGNLTIDFNQARVWVGEQPANLTTTEYRLLIHFAQNAGQLFSGQQILRAVWGEEYANDRDVLWVSLARLRSKLEQDIKHPVHIVTCSRKGYLMPAIPGVEVNALQANG